MEALAKASEGFSGADMNILVRQAIMEPVRKCKNATHFKTVIGDDGEEKLTPCSPGDPDPTRVETTLMKIDPKKLLPPQATASDFEAALEHSKSSVSAGDLQQFEAWTHDFGVEG